MKAMKRAAAVFLLMSASVLSVFSCVMTTASKNADVVQMDDIVILHTNDVHCGIEDNIGYAGLAYYKQEMREITPHVMLVDCGDAIQGAPVGTVSKGEYIIDIMNRLGYEAAIFGNHEFDYNATQLAKLVSKAKFPYLAANIRYTGDDNEEFYYSDESYYDLSTPDKQRDHKFLEGGLLKPYMIKEFGNTKVAFIGVSTPYSVKTSTPKYFMERLNNMEYKYVFGFYTGKANADSPMISSPVNLYQQVQYYVDSARKEGAKYVVALCHLGLEEECEPDRATDLIANTTGIDAVLDGHSHSTVIGIAKNKSGKDVVYAQTGAKLMNIGRLTIKPNGQIRAYLIEDVKARSVSANAFVQSIKKKYEDKLKEEVGNSEVAAMSLTRPDKSRAVRNRETMIGDFCADAYRYVGQADIGLINGGGITGDLPKGVITLNDLLNIHPYGNTLTVVKVKGSVIRNALEYACRSVMKEASDGNGNARGESGGFQQVSGLKFEIDPDVEPNFVADNSGYWKSAGNSDNWRVKNIKVLKWGNEQDGTKSRTGNWNWSDENAWEDLDMNADYEVASHNYLLENVGDGFTMFNGAQIVSSGTVIDNQVLIRYMEEKLNGSITSADYNELMPRRITVLNAVNDIRY